MLVQGAVLKKTTSVKKESDRAKLKEDTIAFALESALNMRLGTCTRIIHYCYDSQLYLLQYTIDLLCIQPQVSLLCTTLIDHWLFVCLEVLCLWTTKVCFKDVFESIMVQKPVLVVVCSCQDNLYQ